VRDHEIGLVLFDQFVVARDERVHRDVVDADLALALREHEGAAEDARAHACLLASPLELIRDRRPPPS